MLNFDIKINYTLADVIIKIINNEFKNYIKGMLVGLPYIVRYEDLVNKIAVLFNIIDTPDIIELKDELINLFADLKLQSSKHKKELKNLDFGWME